MSFKDGFIGSIVGGFLFLGIAYLAIGIEDLNYLKEQKRLLENNVRHELAFKFEDKIYRCGLLITNEASLEIMRRKNEVK